MQVTSLLSRNQEAPTDGHTHGPLIPLDESPAALGQPPLRLQQTLIGLVFIVNAYIVEWFFAKGTAVGGVSTVIGATLLGAPIVWTSIKDLRRGILSINEVVSLAVLASFATGDYKTAGIVSFFMLLGKIIETRTAAGARASIESLIKLTPTKARRVTGNAEEEIATKELAVCDVIRVQPGDNIAADGIIVSGTDSINQATITGESLPVDKKTGDRSLETRRTQVTTQFQKLPFCSQGNAPRRRITSISSHQLQHSLPALPAS